MPFRLCSTARASRRWRKCWCRRPSARTSGWSESPPRWTERRPARSSGGRRARGTARAAQFVAGTAEVEASATHSVRPPPDGAETGWWRPPPCGRTSATMGHPGVTSVRGGRRVVSGDEQARQRRRMNPTAGASGCGPRGSTSISGPSSRLPRLELWFKLTRRPGLRMDSPSARGNDGGHQSNPYARE